MRPKNNTHWDRNVHRVFFLLSFVLVALLCAFATLDRNTRGDFVKAHARPAPLDPAEFYAGER